MSGTQKLIVAVVAVLVAAGTVLGAIALLREPSDPTLATGENASSSPSVTPEASLSIVPPSESPQEPKPATEKTEKLKTPGHVHADALSGTRVRVQWKATGQGVRYFEVLESGKSVGKVPAGKRNLAFETSYGSHCFRVQAVAVASAAGGFSDSSPSSCGQVTLTKPEPVGPALGSPCSYRGTTGGVIGFDGECKFDY